MERTTRKLRLCGALILLNLLWIWGNSMLPGSVSGAISGWLRDLLAAIFPGGSDEPDAGHGLLRKLGHFTEFACLGSLLAWLFAMLQRNRAWALLGGFLAAGMDETIQRFAPDRGPSIWDVLLDTAGVAAGIGLLFAGYTLYKKQKDRRPRKREKMDGAPAGSHSDSDHDGLQTEQNGHARFVSDTDAK